MCTAPAAARTSNLWQAGSLLCKWQHSFALDANSSTSVFSWQFPLITRHAVQHFNGCNIVQVASWLSSHACASA
jgi:hypothetical protein